MEAWEIGAVLVIAIIVGAAGVEYGVLPNFRSGGFAGDGLIDLVNSTSADPLDLNPLAANVSASWVNSSGYWLDGQNYTSYLLSNVPAGNSSGGANVTGAGIAKFLVGDYGNGTFWAINGSDFSHYAAFASGSAAALTTFQAMVTASANGSISIAGGSGLVIAGQINITQPISIIADTLNYHYGVMQTNYGGRMVWFDKICINSSTTAPCLQNVRLDNLVVSELHIVAATNFVRSLQFNNLAIAIRTGYHGVWIEGDGTSNGWIDDIKFDSPFFASDASIDGANWGMVSFNNTRQMTEVRFDKPEFEGGGDGTAQTVFMCQNNAAVDSLFVTEPRFFYDAAITSMTVFYVKAPINAYLSSNFYLSGGRSECHTNSVFLYYEPTSNERSMNVKNFGTTWQCDGGKTYTVLNTMGNIYWTTNGCFTVQGCVFGGGGTISLGTNLTRNNRIECCVTDNVGLNPFGLATTPYKNDAIMPVGLTNTNDPAQWCTIEYADIEITVSGGTAVNCTVIDRNGNVWAGIKGNATLSNVYIPRGLRLLVYSSGTPTTTIWFR